MAANEPKSDDTPKSDEPAPRPDPGEEVSAVQPVDAEADQSPAASQVQPAEGEPSAEESPEHEQPFDDIIDVEWEDEAPAAAPRRTPWAALVATVGRLARRGKAAPTSAGEEQPGTEVPDGDSDAEDAPEQAWSGLPGRSDTEQDTSVAGMSRAPTDDTPPPDADGQSAFPEELPLPEEEGPSPTGEPPLPEEEEPSRPDEVPLPEDLTTAASAGSAPAAEEPGDQEWPPPDEPEEHDEAAMEAAAMAAAAAPSRRRRPRWPWYALGAVALVAIIIVAGLLFLPQIVEGQLLARLRDMGFTQASLSVESAGTDRAVVRDLHLGPEASAEEVVATYSLSGIQDGVIDQVTIRGLRAKLTADETGPLFGSLDEAVQNLLAPSEEPSGFAVPPVTLEDAIIEVATPLGPATVRLEGKVEPDPEAEIDRAADFDVAIDAPLGRIQGRLAATVDPDGVVAGSFIVTEGAIAVADQGSTSLAGYVQFVLSDSGEIRQLASNLNLTAPSVAGAAFTTGTLRAELSPETASLNLLLDDASDAFDLRGTLVVQNPFGDGALSGLIETTVGPDAPVWSAAAIPAPTAGRLRATATVSAALPPGVVREPQRLLDAVLAAPGLAGSVQFDLEDMAWPDLGQNIFASGGLDLMLEDGNLVATVPAEILGEITPAPALLDGLGLPAELREGFSGRTVISLGFAESLLVVPNSETITLSGRPLLTLIAPGGQELSADVWTSVRIGRDGALREFRIDSGKLSATGLSVEGFDVTSLELNGSIVGSGDTVTGTVRVAAKLPVLSIDGDVTLRGVDLLLDCDLAAAGTVAIVQLTGDDSRLIARVIEPDVVRTQKPLELPLRPNQDPFFAVDWGPPDGPSFTFDLATGPLAFTATLDTDLPLPTRLARTTLTGAWSPQAGFTFSAVTDGSRATMPTMGLAASDVWIRTDVDAEGITRIKYRMGSLTQSGEDAYLLPLSVSGSVTIDDVRVRFDATGRAAGPGLVVKASGQHRLGPNNGEVDLVIEPLVFEPDGLQPASLYPPLADAIEQAAGKVAVEGRVAWDEETDVLVKVRLEDLTIKTPQVTLTGVNGTITLDGVDPPTTPPNQQIFIGTVDLGLPLTDGVLTFQLLPENRLRVEHARLTLAGGEVAARPAVVDWTSGTQEVELLVHDVDLQKLLALADIDGLSAEGKLAGSIPVLVQDGAVIIRDGKLVAQAPGAIRYAPEDEPGVGTGAQAAASASESMDLVLDLLHNFQYTGLAFGLERDADGDMRITVGLDGSNPDVYDGYPIDFNLTLTGNIDQLLSY